MSNLFSGNPPSGGSNGNGRDGQEKAPFSFSRPAPGTGTAGAAGAGATGGATAPRAPLFPPREGQQPLFPRPAAPAPTPSPVTPVSAGTAPRPPLFPRRDPAAPATPAASAPAGSSLFPSRAAEPAKTPAHAGGAPLFPRRDPVAPAAPSPYGAARPTTPPPVAPFGSRLTSPVTPASSARSMFGAAPTPAAPVFASPSTQLSTPAFPASQAGREAKISDEEFVLLRDFLYQQSGIYIAENRKYLVENRLASRLRELGLRSFGEYYKYLRYDANRSSEMNKLFESMTTNETSFFRNQPQLDVFRDKVLAKVIAEQRAKGQKKLRIWSAGCSSGEEPYTIAIILYEVLKQEIGSWDIKITANDLSLAMLATARRGIYNDYAIRTTPPDMLARYFTKEGSQYRLDSKLQELVSFSQINLSDKLQLQKVERSQIVFCRNVIIYFDDEMKKNVINAYYDNLLPGGYLIIGHSESLHNISRAFKPEHHTGSIVYCKQN